MTLLLKHIKYYKFLTFPSAFYEHTFGNILQIVEDNG